MNKKLYFALLTLLFSASMFGQCTVTINQFAPTCHGTCDGDAKAIMAGAVGPFTYSWSTTPSQTTQTATGLCAGTYTVKVNNATGCSVTGTVTLAQPAPLAITTTQVNEKCNGNTTASATATVSGGTPAYSYSWSTVPAQTTKTARNLTAGTYTVLVTDRKGCLISAVVTITQPTALNLTMTTTNTACGASTGTANVAVTGGTGPHTYAWSTTPVNTTSGLSNLPSGSFTVTVTDSNGCQKSSVATIGNTSGMTATISAQTNVSCNAGSNGSATITPTGGTAPYTYSWSTFPAQTTPTVSGLPAGNYYVSVTDASGCSFILTVTITQPAVLTSAMAHVNVACKGSATGTATATPAGGTAPYTYSWNTVPAQTTAMASGLIAGTYTVTITDSHGCSLTKTVTITQPANAVGGSVTHTNDKCHGGAGASATANPTGGTAPYTYSWSTIPSQATKTATGLRAGTYHVLVTDSKGCTFLDSAVITQPVAIVLTTSTISSGCGASNGSASVVISSGGVHPYTYSWNTTPVQTTAMTTSTLGAGVYQVTVTDSNGCKSSAPATINNTGAATLSITATNVPCRGTATGTATVTASGGTTPYTYSWNTTPSQTTATASGLSAGNYTVSVTEPNGCSSIASIRITQPATALTSTMTQVNETCNGATTATATANPTGGTPGYTFSWHTAPPQTTATASNLTAGAHTVTITDAAGCTLNKVVNITQPAIVFGVVTQTNVSCNGGMNGVASVTGFGGTGPYTYSWNTTPPQTIRTITGLGAGTYSVLITDSKGCSKTKVVTITQPAAITLTTSSTTAHCGNTDGSATVNASGGTATLTYSWATTPVQTATTATNLGPGIYNITVTDSMGCNKTSSVTVNNAGAPTLTATSVNPTCFGSSNGSATATATGGSIPYTYSWSTTPSQTTAAITNQPAGVYTIKVTDTHNCSSNLNVTLTQPMALTTTTAMTNVSCTSAANGTATVTVAGGTPHYTYSWSSTPSQTTATASNLAPGSYTVTVTDSASCTAASTVTIIKNAITATSFHTNLMCNGATTGTATVNISNGTLPFTYSWNTTPVQNTATAGNLAAGTYTATVTDSAGCSASSISIITQPAALAVVCTPQNESCPSGGNGSVNASVSGGVAPYTYSWNSTPAQTTFIASGLAAGTYTVSVTDTNHCMTTQVATITQPAAFVTNTSSTNSTCGSATGSATATATGGTGAYTYSWNTTPSQSTSTATAIAAGVYVCTITDANGCSTTATATVNNNSSAVATVSSSRATCFTSSNGTATITLTGGTAPFTYSWATTPSQSTPTATNLMPGTYSVVVTDAAGCTTPASVIVASPPALTATTSIKMPLCNGSSNGSAMVMATGGSPHYTYSWSTTPAQTTVTATGLAAGSYTVTITDSLGCTTPAVATVTQPAVLAVSVTSTNTSCFGKTDGTATGSASGGTAPFMYSWNTAPVQNTQTASNLAPGTYSVTVTDSNACMISGLAIITAPAQIITTTSLTPATCGNSDGSATITVNSGGIGLFSFLWTPNGAVTATNSNIPAGVYMVYATDANGCSVIDTVDVGNSNAGIATVTSNSGCLGMNNGMATVTMAGGTPTFVYSWNTTPVQTAATATGLAPGLYKVMVTDSSGCITFASGTVITPVALITDSLTQTPVSCGSCSDGTAKIYASGGTAPYTYSWSTSPSQTTQNATGLSVGIYYVCITDVSGCMTCDSVSINHTMGILVYDQGNTKLTFFPNPSSGLVNLNIQSIESQPMEFRIVNLVGETVYSEKMDLINGTLSKTVDLSSYPKGLYLIQMVLNQGSVTQKLILH